MNYMINFVSVPWQTPMANGRHKVIKHGDMRLRLLECRGELEPPWCEKGYIGYILEGQLEITFENERLVYNSRDRVLIPSWREHKHSVRVLSEVVRVVFVEET